MDGLFLINSILLGVGLAMDAFSVSLANGLNDFGMHPTRMSAIAGVFALFQAVMPMLGWVCVHTIMQYFKLFERLVPWIALILLLYIGGQMLVGGLRQQESDEPEQTKLGVGALLMQGVATSIDALSVGFTIADFDAVKATVCAVIIAAVTFVICMGGLVLGKKFGTKLSNKAEILGGSILILIGIEIFLKGIL